MYGKLKRPFFSAACKLLPLHRLSMSTLPFQFRQEQSTYYPDRHEEMQRINEQRKSQLIAETQPSKRYPQDHYYKLLGLRKQASAQQIKAAYYSLAKLFHPDASNTPQETKRFQDISSAYQILSDEAKRKQYDDWGTVTDDTHKSKGVGGVGPAVSTGKQQPRSARGLKMNMEKNATAGAGAAAQTPTSREELMQMTSGELKLDIDFLEAAHGAKKTIDLRFLKKCPGCMGKAPRLVSRSKSETCNKCNGTGQLHRKTATYSCVTVCDQCEGKRFINRHKCSTCDNRGIVLESVKVAVAVPSGARSGDLITTMNPATQQPVHYRLAVKESQHYKRVDNDVYTDRFLSISQAVLGGEIRVNGIYEDIDIKVAPGTASHTQVVLKGKGIRTRDGIGDHIITFKVQIPQHLSMKQRQLIMALAKTEDPIKPAN